MSPNGLTSPPSSPSRLILYNFTSQWFLIPQGTGIIAVILHQLDYQFSGLHTLSYIFWLLTIILLVVILLLYLARCVLFSRHVAHALSHDTSESACLASISISYTAVIQMIALALVPSWGKGWGVAAYTLWWTNVAMTVVVVVGVPFVYIRLYPGGVPHLSPGSQLPMIAALTAAAGAGVVCQFGEISPQLQVPAILVSYLLIGMGLPLAFALDVLFWARLLDRSLPDRQHTFQDMILCGPWGQGSFALQALGGAVMKGSFAGYDSGMFITARAAEPVGYVSMFAGLLCWGMGTFWWCFAILSIAHGATDGWRLKGIPYGLVAWSVVFPWGVYTNAAVQLGKILDSEAFKVWSTALTVILVIVWLWNMLFTIKGIVNGSLLGLDRGWKRHM
ncbi:voltage-dependent anion channel [Coniochaeta sp. 2T2.1]|nr:voltage-dependent anion channel [Coniochaeta sp. 2T2.1]